MSKIIDALHGLGQSLWYDNIERRLLENGELAAMIERGEIRGVTSNPSIFQQAIAKSSDYDAALTTMAWSGYSAEQIFDRLALEDIRAAADLFLPLYRQTNGADGYVSLEVSPALAHDTAATVAEAKRLWAAVDRPNLMVKIPATLAGVPAVRQAIAAGLNVNVTLIFSLNRYNEVLDAYLTGLEDRLSAGQPLAHVASVASFFVSRMDSKIDGWLDKLVKDGGPSEAAALQGKLAVANARLAYARFEQVFASPRFAHLQAAGAHVQRPLWASTSTKNPAYPDTLYVDDLIAAQTVNTVPPKTLVAFGQHGKAALAITSDTVADAHQVMARLAALGLSADRATDELEQEGVQAFGDAFTEMLQTIEQRRRAAVAQLGSLAPAVAGQMQRFAAEDAPARMHKIDPSLWTTDPAGQEEIRRRLGWLNLPYTSQELAAELRSFASEALAAGFTHLLLLGMGGSSLAPEVMRLMFGLPETQHGRPGGLDLAIVDSTDPGQVRAAARRAPVEKTLYIISSKSGGTAEVNAFLDYFWSAARRSVGAERAGQHFVAITDPGTSLEKLARERQFRRVFLADPTVGGRYSALSPFGLAPAALLGIDLGRLLSRTAWLADQCAADVPAGRNPGLALGAILGQAALQGRDKLTLLADEAFTPFGAWMEQLVAESCGKQGVGIVPIDGEPLAETGLYGQDRLFVYLRTSGRYDRAISRLRKAGFPALTFNLSGVYDLGAEFYRWEVATAAACMVLGVNAFDQPDVQDSKNRTTSKIQFYRQHHRLDEGQPVWEGDGVRLYAPGPAWQANTLADALRQFMAASRPGDYLALNTYLARNVVNVALLRRLRVAVRRLTGSATTVGFGPRFLHSTGQLHKGGGDNGMFLQITSDPLIDLTIPGQGMTFATLERAQALGDLEALFARQRRALRIHLESPLRLRALVELFEVGLKSD